METSAIKKISHLSTERRAMLVGMSEAGLKYTEISQNTGISKSTIKDIVHRYHVQGSVETAPRSGRPRKLVDRDLRGLQRLASTN
ncbi:hypothetical protein BY996DRAFT_4623928 [Phakopsora pachyrhizi]|nr:hypothetical protein BY996DRAFT_4623928 [Phakopsora pachyrhizi]